MASTLTSEMKAGSLGRRSKSPLLRFSSIYREVWEQRPMVLRRHMPHYNDGWFSTQELDSILREVGAACMS